MPYPDLVNHFATETPRPSRVFGKIILSSPTAVWLAAWFFLAFPPLLKAQLPVGWSDTDLGSPTYAGSAAVTNGLWTVSGGGMDIWSTSDAGNFVGAALNSDGAVIAYVTSIQNSDPATEFSKAGVMMRGSTNADSANAYMLVTAGAGVCFQYRTVDGGGSYITVASGVAAPIWLKVVRSADNFSGYYSPDGVFWIQVGDAATIEMNGSAQAGLAVTAHNDAALNTSTFTNVSLTKPVFGIYRELWTNLDAGLGNTLAALTNPAYNPGWPNVPATYYTHVFTNFETEVNLPVNYFGQRLRAFVVPPTNGFYAFNIASDDTSQLFLSPDEQPGDALGIASVPSFTGYEAWTQYPSQQSVQVYLQAGRRYYLEAQMQQGSASENLSVRWQLPDFSFEQPLASASPAGTLLIPFTGVDVTPGIFTQSSNTTVVENVGATFSVLVTNQSPVTYQWFGSGAIINGATQCVYPITAADLSLNNEVLTCVISNSAGVITSAPATLTVLRDTVPPALTGVANIGTTNVQLVFSKPLATASATNLANYRFTDGAAITGATLAADNLTVTLTTASLVYGSNYDILLTNLYDLASTPNVIVPGAQASFTASPFTSQDIGAPAFASTFTLTTNGVNVTGEGSIGNYDDQFNIEYKIQTGDFDVSVCLASLSLSDLYAEAGMMARATLAANSAFAAALATPGLNGEFFADRQSSNTLAVTSGTFPVNYPNTWVRLSRVGQVFTGFGSYDGVNWTQLGSATIAMPAQIYLGLAVASHSTNQPTTAQFLNYENTPANAVIATTLNPHEPLGPSSRKTGIVISEIMYKPAARTDANNVEFLEIYNSNPFFQDISSYQITCADMNYTFPSNTLIPGGGFFVLAASPPGIASVYGLTSNVFGPYHGSLKKSETLQMLDEQSNVLLTIPYTATYPWPVAADGPGHSIVLANPTYGEGDPRAWDISDTIGGSPGQSDSFNPSPLRSVVINELLPHSENAAVPQFIELYNHATNSVDISGCILTDDPTTNKFVIPSGTILGPAGFVSFSRSQFGFSLNGAGETLYFIKPDGSRILDAVAFAAQADGVSYGRWPDGANDFYAFTTNTPGTNNSTIAIADIVINELMYDPISGNDDDQYIELYNQGTNTINLGGWQFTSGVTFTFPANTWLLPNSYLAVSRNVTNLFSKYTNLNPGNTIGNYTGKLSHGGELVALAMPQTFYGTNTIYVEQDQVAYGIGGRWGQWSGGGGSSLELIDPHSNHRLAANWTDSDDAQKSAWVDIENTGVLDNGGNYDPSIDYAQIGILDVGECLVDNIEVDDTNGLNYVSNPTFEAGLGLANWSLQGCMVRSSLESSGYQSGYSLHIRNSDRFWTGDNSCQVALSNTNLQPGQTVTLRFKARWLHGWPEALLRLNGNWLEATATMPVPANLGSPGGPNSRYVTNAGPAIYNVTHVPSLPSANQAVVVTAQAHDPDGIQNLTLYYRLDPATNYTAVTMRDDGSGGDAIAGDGVFSATIPGQSSNTIAAFYISATDNPGAGTMFPALRNGNNEPVREGLVMFGDGNPGGSFGVYHLWISQTNATRWTSLSDLSNEGNDCTFVNGSRVIYNMQGRFAGSPYHQDFDTPAGSLCHYKWEFNDDDMFLGATDFNKIHQPGNFPGDDASIQREQLANTFLRALGVPWLYKRYAVVYVNGNRRGQLMEDTQLPDGDIVKEHFPNDPDGFLYKMQPWFEMAPFPSGQSIGFQNNSWCNLQPYTTTGGVKKAARYRYNFEIRRTPDSESDFTNIFSLIDAANAYGTPNYAANLENLANLENWMRVFAANHAAGNWDSFGAQSGQNLYGYAGTQGTKFSLLMWDFNIVFGSSGSWGPGVNLFLVDGGDINLQNIYQEPTFQRMYWRALQNLVNGPLNPAISGPLLDAKFNSFADNNLTVENPDVNIKPWLNAAQTSIAAQLAVVNASNFAINSQVTVSNNVAYVSGQAPVNVGDVWINGSAYPLTWTSLTNWLVAVPVAAGTNVLTVQAVDVNGHAIAGDSGSVNGVSHDASPSPVGQVVINEIMYNPPDPAGQFVELYNNSSSITFDLSGWQFQGLSYTFPAGASLGPNSFLVLAANNFAFADLYGATNPVFDVFPGPLATNGPTILALIQPGAGGSNNVTVAEVAFDSVAPWPTGANGLGSSLQLIDPMRDNWRVGNWSGGYPPAVATPDATNSIDHGFFAFQPLWINEVQAQNLQSIANSAGQFTPWIELFNPTTNPVSLNGLYLADDYINLTNWAFPANATIGPGQFEIIFVDGETNLTTLNELHAGFTLAAGSGSVALSRIFGGQVQVLDYLNYTNLPAGDSYGSLPDGQSFSRAQFSIATPGASNSIATSGTIAYYGRGSIYTQNFDSLPQPGVTTVDSADPVTLNGITYSAGDPLNFASAILATGSGGLGLSGTMPGWFGWAATAMKLGASAGDQSTGGIISFGPVSGAATNRALGLLATSSTGATAFGVSLLNETTNTLNQMSVSFLGELWRQQPSSKTLSFAYYIDPTGTNSFPTNGTTALHGLDVNFLTGSYNAQDGTQAANQVFLSVSNQTISAWPSGAALWLMWQMTNNAGSSQGLAIDNFSFSASSTLVSPAITQSPQNQSVNTGNNPSFSVTAASAFALSYQWQFNGTNIAGATNSSLTLNNVVYAQQGSYDVIVSNLYGATLSNPAELTVNIVTGSPVLNPQPASQTNYLGSTATFFVTASGDAPMSYQWRFNGNNITGANAATLVLSNLTAAAQGNYQVFVTNVDGSATSQLAVLTVVAMPPSLVTQPASQVVAATTKAVFAVTAAGTAPLTYQWLFGGVPLTNDIFHSGVTNASFTVSNVEPARTGNYTVMVGNSAGSVLSQTAVLSLAAPSYLAYTNAGAVYFQNFDSLPDPGTVTISAANPVTISNIAYSLADPVDFAFPVETTNGGIGLAATMAGWYGSATTMKFGASAGDQSTGGLISFGTTNSLATNRALGLLTTSATGPMAFGLRILNQTGLILTNLNLGFTGELWRQQTSAKTISVGYYIDPTGSNGFSPSLVTGVLTNLALGFATGSSSSGTAGPLMTATLGVTNQPITVCEPGAALWLVWQMTNTTSGSQGLAIDNLTFSANGTLAPSLSITYSNSAVLVSWPAWATGYVLQYSGNLLLPNQWMVNLNPVVTNGNGNTVVVPITNQVQFFRLAY